MARHAPRGSLVMVAGAASVSAAIEAVKTGARDHVLQPRRSKGNRELAAHLLGISPRTLYYKLRVYGFE